MKRWICLGLSFLLAAAIPLSARGEEACSAKAAIVTEAVSGTALYEKNADLRLPEASTTKIMTALIALEESTLTHRITVSPKAAAVEGSQLGLTAGAELSVSDLLYVLMMKSGNDAAVALAEGICGSEEAFVERMNRRAEELGLKNTRFENPHGLPAEGHYTTARDLAELTAAALENEAFRKLVSTERTRLEYQNKVLTNSNKLLSTCEGIFGVKTGFTKKAGRCLVTAAERRGITLICVTLNDPDDWKDHATLYDLCYQRVERQSVLAPGEYPGLVPVLGGDQGKVSNALPLTCITVDGAPIPYRISSHTVPRLFAPMEAGRTVGEVKVLSDTGRCFSRSPLNLSYAVSIKKEKRTFPGSFLLKLRKLFRALTS